MLKVINNKDVTLYEAFNLSEQDLNSINYFLQFYEDCSLVSKAIERIWVDETINDNVKAFAIFSVGRLNEHRRLRKER